MAEELNDQNVDLNNQSPGGEPPVTEPVTEGEPGTPEPQKVPETVPYSRFQEVNEEKKGLREVNERLLSILERSGTAAPGAQTPPAKEPEIPKPDLLSMPSRDAFTKEVDGYSEYDEAAHLAAIGTVAQENAVRMVRHEHMLETTQNDMQRRQEKGNALVNEVIEKHPEFRELMNQNVPSPAVGEALFILGDDQEDRPSVVEAAFYLAKNPSELRRLNAMPPQAAIAAVGKLVAKLALTTTKPKTVSEAPNPTGPIKTTETPTNFDPNKSSTEEYIRHSGHPAVEKCPWLNK